MGGHKLVCTMHGSEVTLAGSASFGRLLVDLYGEVGQSKASVLAAGLRRLNPSHAHQLSHLESVVPRGATLLLPSEPSVATIELLGNSPEQDRIRRSILEIQRNVDMVPPLRGAGIVLVLPAVEPLLLRNAPWVDACQTWIRLSVEIPVASRVRSESWWNRWSDSAITCGAAAFGVGATALACGATPFTAGASAPVCIASWVGTSASGAQCVLATTKVLSDDFAAYVETEDGRWINHVDVSLDLISLGVGVASVPNALKSTSSVYRMSRYSRYLSRVDKGKLVKTMARVEGLLGEMPEIRRMFEMGLKVSNPAGKRQLTNNIVKRMLPKVRSEIRRRTLQDLSAIIGATLSSVSSARGGVGSESWGILRNVKVEIYQLLDPRAPSSSAP